MNKVEGQRNEMLGMVQQLMQFVSLTSDEAYKNQMLERLKDYAPQQQAPPQIPPQ